MESFAEAKPLILRAQKSKASTWETSEAGEAWLERRRFVEGVFYGELC